MKVQENVIIKLSSSRTYVLDGDKANEFTETADLGLKEYKYSLLDRKVADKGDSWTEYYREVTGFHEEYIYITEWHG